MDEKKQARIEKMELQSADLMQKIRAESDMKKKQKLIAERERIQRKVTAVRNDRVVSREAKRDMVAYSFIAPNFIGFAVFTLVPIVFAFALAFMNWDGSNEITFVGLDNFARLPQDTFFVAALKNTIIYVIGTVPLTMIASLALAIVLNQKIVARGFFRTVAFFPYVASLVAITAVWSMIFHPSKGPSTIFSTRYSAYRRITCPSGSAGAWFW